MNVSATAAEWAADQAKTEAEAFEQAMSRIISPAEFKVNDEVEQAYREGYEKGYKEADKGVIIKNLRIIADHYGFTSQANMLCEESAEFTVALNKLRRGSQEEYSNIKEELADVLVVALQLRYILGEKIIDNIIEQKIQRQLRRINDEKTN